MSSLTAPWTLGGIELPNRVVLAPLAGIGNWFVRLQAKRFGAGFAVSEMVSSFGLKYGDERTHREFLRMHPDEHPMAVQLFGHDAEVMRIAAPERITSASWPKSWIETGCSSGCRTSSSRRVRSFL